MLTDLFWRTITTAVVKRENVKQLHRAPSDDDYVRPIRLGRRYPGLGTVPSWFSENTPVTEREDQFGLVGLKVVMKWKDRFPLAASYPEPWTGPDMPYPPEYQMLRPAPDLPPEFREGADRLAGVAQRGPFSLYAQKDGDEFILDLRALEPLQPRAPFIATGGLARFARKADGTLRTTSLESFGKTLHPSNGRPADQGWGLAEKRMLVALNSYSTLVDHLTYVHIAGAGTFTVVTHMALGTRHPLRILMQPFIVETMRVNNDNIDGLILSEHSNVPSYTGYPLATVNAAVRNALDIFDIRRFDAEYFAASHGYLDDPTFPTIQSTVDLYRIFLRFTTAWCAAHLKEIDLETRIWCQELDYRIPNGIKKLIGIDDFDELTSQHVAHLCAVGMFTASVWHYVVANMPREYELHFKVMPPVIDANGHPSRGAVYEKRNSITIADLFRYALLDEFVYLPTSEMQTMWSKFQAELRAYEAELADDPAMRRYKVAPSKVPSSVHA